MKESKQIGMILKDYEPTQSYSFKFNEAAFLGKM